LFVGALLLQESEKESEKGDDERDMKCASSMCVCVYAKGENKSERTSEPESERTRA